MAIELNKDIRAEAIASIERYFRENMDEPIGNIAAGALLGFFIEEIGPSIYNTCVAVKSVTAYWLSKGERSRDTSLGPFTVIRSLNSHIGLASKQ